MKKIILSLIAVIACMSINAQQVKVLKTTDNGTSWSEVKTYTNTESEKYKVVFGEIQKKGKAAVSESAGITGNEVEWVQLWADGPKWAVFNVGANSASECGGYYHWGKTVNKARDISYSSSTTDIQGTSDDTAKNLWGDNWQMPTETDYENLLANCDVAWTTQNGRYGRLYTGKGDYSSNSVFFPAAGVYEYYDNYVSGVNANGFYWSSTPYESDSQYAYKLYFITGVQKTSSKFYRAYGCSVRAILKEK